MREMSDTMTQTCVPALAKLAPEAGAYLNEVSGDPQNPFPDLSKLSFIRHDGTPLQDQTKNDAG